MAVPEGVDLFFFRQTSFRRQLKRCRKLPEELPHSLRFAHLSPKVAALLASKEKMQRPPDEDDGLGKNSLMPEITHSFYNVKSRLDALMENDEDSQRYLFEEARMSAANILFQLAKFLYIFYDIRSCIPKSLEYLLMVGWKEMTLDVIIVPREWQTLAMREAHASSSKEQITPDDERDTDRHSADVENVKTKSPEKPDTAKSKRKLPTLGKLGLSEITEDTELDQKKSPSIRRSEIKERSSGNLKLKPPRSDRMKSVYAESQAGIRSPGSQRANPDERSISTVRDTPSELRFGHNAYLNSVVQFQLSSKACEDKGWIVSEGNSVEGLDQNTALEWSVHILRAAMKAAKEDSSTAGDTENESITQLRYYGDTLQNQVNKYKMSKQSANPVHRGLKPRIPDMYTDQKNEGRKLMQATTNDGSTTIFYPSGRPAVVTSQAGFGRPGFYTLAYEDEPDPKMLACFTPSGKGVCYHSNGVIRFVATEKGGHLAGTEGCVIRKWKWPLGGLKLSDAVGFQVNNHLAFRCYSRSTMLLLFSCQKEIARFPVGPVFEAVESKPGDEEQLLTSYAFTSRAAADLTRIFAPKKPPPKTKKKKVPTATLR